MIGTAGATRRATATLALRTLTVTAAGCASGVTRPAAKPTASAGSAAQRTTQLSALTRQLVEAAASGVIVRVDDGSGHVIQIAEQAPWITADHVLTVGDEFWMGSSTKTTLVTLVLERVAENKIGPDEPLSRRNCRAPG